MRYLNDENKSFEDISFSYENFKYLLEKEQNKEILTNQAKEVFKEMISTNKSPDIIIKEK
jgi:Asp-tRNA(Asn)/Glu-tRNA(Gln) amidotransferase B subunit